MLRFVLKGLITKLASLHILTPRILKWLQDFWEKIFTPTLHVVKMEKYVILCRVIGHNLSQIC